MLKIRNVRQNKISHVHNECPVTVYLKYKSTFQKTIGVQVGRNCAPLLADLFLRAYETSVNGFLRIKMEN